MWAPFFLRIGPYPFGRKAAQGGGASPFRSLLHLEDKPVLHGELPVAHVRKGAVMSDNHNCLSVPLPHVKEQPVNLLLGHGIEVSGRLIGKENRRTVNQSPRDGYSLGLSAGKRLRLVVKTLRKSDLLKQSPCPRLRFLTPLTCDKCRNHDVLKSSEFREQMMRLEHETYFSVPEL